MAARLMWRSGGGRGAVRTLQLQRVLGFSTSSAAVGPAGEISAAASSLHSQEAGKKWGLSVLVLILPCAATFGLGSWQLVRREKKIELLDFRRARFEEDPIALEEALAIKRQSVDNAQSDVLQYRKVYCEGVLDESKSLFVGPRSRTLYGAAEKGYYIVTPLICKSSSDTRVQLPVLVNRGWVPSSMRNEAMAQEQAVHEQPAHAVVKDVEEANIKETKQRSWWSRWGKPQVTDQEEVAVAEPERPIVRVAGVIRDGEQPNMFVPNNQPEIGQWFYVDVPAMARVMGLPEDVTYMEAVATSSPDREGRKKFPLPKESDSFLKSSVMPQDHLNYALTWYTLSAATSFMAVKRLQNLKRGR
ncbi:hypothetical protein M758_5G172400 [Ceratodon purpureus]|nr:hypothetical protein M758_5G172400 [Ceratodon purpureus]